MAYVNDGMLVILEGPMICLLPGDRVITTREKHIIYM